MNRDLDAVVVLTATISPGDVIYCDRNLVAQRLKDYLHAFKFWLGEPFVKKLVFVENSGFDLEYFKDSVKRHPGASAKKVEILGFQQPPFDRNLGKSYGEMLILQHAIRHSKLVANSEVILKGTGRYVPTNFFKVWPQLSPIGDVDIIANFYQFPAVADSRFFLAKPDIFEEFLFPLIEKINDGKGYYFEHALAEAIQNTVASGRRWRSFPGGGFLVDGVQGSTNTVYAYPHWKRYAYRAIASLRNGVPFRWRLGAPVARHREKPD